MREARVAETAASKAAEEALAEAVKKAVAAQERASAAQEALHQAKRQAKAELVCDNRNHQVLRCSLSIRKFCTVYHFSTERLSDKFGVLTRCG